jgi:hypothetical protein
LLIFSPLMLAMGSGKTAGTGLTGAGAFGLAAAAGGFAGFVVEDAELAVGF